jgi:hypothetical protein
VNFVSAHTPAQERLFLQYIGPRDDFDIVIVGSGSAAASWPTISPTARASTQRILVLEAGSFVYPTHVYNVCRFPNSSLARHFGCDTFWQAGHPGSEHYIGEKPQLNFGGRSIFWSGLIPTVQAWELEFFPARAPGARGRAAEPRGQIMNESRSMGAKAQAVVTRLRESPLASRLLDPGDAACAAPAVSGGRRHTERPVLHGADRRVQHGRTAGQPGGAHAGVKHGDGPGLHILLNHFVEDVQNRGSHVALVARNTLTGQARTFRAGAVVLAAGSIESPKLLRRSSLFPWLPDPVKSLVGRGLTDHPTSNEITTFVTASATSRSGRGDHAKIVFYSRGDCETTHNQIRYPFNVEMNINHEYWHLRENDPSGEPPGGPPGAARVDIKFSFGNCLDEEQRGEARSAVRVRAGGRLPEPQLGEPSRRIPFPGAGGLAEVTAADLRGAQRGDPRDLLAVPPRGSACAPRG